MHGTSTKPLRQSIGLGDTPAVHCRSVEVRELSTRSLWCARTSQQRPANAHEHRRKPDHRRQRCRTTARKLGAVHVRRRYGSSLREGAVPWRDAHGAATGNTMGSSTSHARRSVGQPLANRHPRMFPGRRLTIPSSRRVVDTPLVSGVRKVPLTIGTQRNSISASRLDSGAASGERSVSVRRSRASRRCLSNTVPCDSRRARRNLHIDPYAAFACPSAMLARHERFTTI